MSTPTSTPSSSPAPVSMAPAPLPSAAIADDDLRRDVHAALAGRQELGPGYDEHFADTLVERLNVQIKREVERQLRLTQRRGLSSSQHHLTSAQRLGLAIPSMVFLIPLIAIAGALGGGLPGMIIAFAAVVAINIAAGLF